MIAGSLSFGKAAVALHYEICSLCVIGASYRQAIKKRYVKTLKEKVSPGRATVEKNKTSGAQ